MTRVLYAGLGVSIALNIYNILATRWFATFTLENKLMILKKESESLDRHKNVLTILKRHQDVLGFEEPKMISDDSKLN